MRDWGVLGSISAAAASASGLLPGGSAPGGRDGSCGAKMERLGQTMTLRVLSPKAAKLVVYDMENPPRDHDATNPNTRMVGFEVDIAPSSTETLVIFLESEGHRGGVPTVSPLTDWR